MFSNCLNEFLIAGLLSRWHLLQPANDWNFEKKNVFYGCAVVRFFFVLFCFVLFCFVFFLCCNLLKARIENAIGPYEDLLTSVKRRKLKWYGHVTRSSGTGQDCPTRNSSRRETKRQTEETMGRQHQRVDWPWMEYHTTESREPRGMEVVWLVACLTSQQHASVSQGRVCSDNFNVLPHWDRSCRLELSISPSHSILTPGRPVLALTL